MSPLLELKNIHKSFGSVPVIKGISLSVDAGQVTCLIGPSGSGKSTLLRCINHLELVDSGEVLVEGSMVGYEPVNGHLKELSAKRVASQIAQIGMVFQRFNLFPHKTAIENVAAGPAWVRRVRRVRRVTRKAALDRARELLDLVGMADRCDHYPNQLSGGRQQRVAIARALAMFIDQGLAVEYGAAREVIEDPSHLRTRAWAPRQRLTRLRVPPRERTTHEHGNIRLEGTERPSSFRHHAGRLRVRDVQSLRRQRHPGL